MLLRLGVLTLIFLSTIQSSAFIFRQAGMDSCEPVRTEQIAASEYGIKIVRLPDGLRVDAIHATTDQMVRRGADRSETLGQFTISAIQQLNPGSREWGSYAMGTGYALLAIFIGAEMVVGYAYANIPGASLLVTGGATAEVGLAGAQFHDALNPVAQFERGRVERCLQSQLESLSAVGSEITFRMNDQDDFNDAVTALRDLVHDEGSPEAIPANRGLRVVLCLPPPQASEPRVERLSLRGWLPDELPPLELRGTQP